MVIERFGILLVRLDPTTGGPVKRLGRLDPETANAVMDTLGELFAP